MHEQGRTRPSVILSQTLHTSGKAQQHESCDNLNPLTAAYIILVPLACR